MEELCVGGRGRGRGVILERLCVSGRGGGGILEGLCVSGRKRGVFLVTHVILMQCIRNHVIWANSKPFFGIVEYQELLGYIIIEHKLDCYTESNDCTVYLQAQQAGLSVCTVRSGPAGRSICMYCTFRPSRQVYLYVKVVC